MAWYDFYRLFTYAFTKDPLARKSDKRRLTGAGVTQPDAMPDLRNADGFTAGAGAYIRVQNDLVDVTSTSNRLNRYKEYDRLAVSIPEIDMSMTVFADESCVVGDTKVATVFHGYKSIKWITENLKEARFPVYCYSFEKEDYTIGWAYDPRVVKKAKVLKIVLHDGTFETVTPDHRILKRDGTWINAENLKFGDELMPFYKLKANHNLNKKIKTNQFPRIYTHNKGWINERQFIDEWRLDKNLKEYERINEAVRLIGSGLTFTEVSKAMDRDWGTIKIWCEAGGFSRKEIKLLSKKLDRKKVIGIQPVWAEEDVYDLSVETHENYCTDSLVVHNCQRDEEGRVFKLNINNQQVKKELESLFFNRNQLNFNQRTMWDKARRLYITGDQFWEIVIDPDNPKAGVQGIQDLPAESMYRIETTKGRLIEFQQAKEGPDLQALMTAPIATATETELAQSNAVRFSPEQIVHTRIGDYRKSFYPYGVSLIEPARGPAHQLRMMEDAMVVYRLVRAPERRIFYIDVGQLPPFKAEAFVDRLKDQFRKKKVVRNPQNTGGASAVEERYHAPAQDEDYWLPIRPGSLTKIDTLPGAQNLGEIDDTVYFRNKLFGALGMPKNYFSLEDPSQTRISLSAQDVRFARLIERLQSYIEDSLWTVADRHLKLIGIPEEAYEDLEIKMTPPSDWRELSRAEVVSNRINNANTLKGSQLFSDKDVLTLIMKYSDEEADEMIARMKIQKLEDLKLQILAQNPVLLGVGMPGGGDQEIGSEPGGPNPMLGGGPQLPGQEGMPGSEGIPPEGIPQIPPTQAGKDEPSNLSMMPDKGQAKPLPEPTQDEILNYDLSIEDYDEDQDVEDVDYTEIGEKEI